MRRKIDWKWIGMVAILFVFAWACDHVRDTRLLALVMLGMASVLAVATALFLARERDDGREDAKIQMYCVVAKESLDLMKGIRGKMMTQAGHAYLHAFTDAVDRFPRLAHLYRRSERAYKITVVVPTVADLHRLHDAYQDVCGVSLVEDAGITVFEKPTVTCLGVGPLTQDLIGTDLSKLNLLT